MMDDELDLRQQKTRDSLVKAVFNILKTNSPYSSIKVLDICKEAHISYMTFYAHFDDKIDLIKYCVNEQLKCLLPIPNKLKPDNLNQFLYYMISFFGTFCNSNKDLIINDYFRIQKKQYKNSYLDILFKTITFYVTKELKIMFALVKEETINMWTDMIVGLLSNCFLHLLINHQIINKSNVYNNLRWMFNIYNSKMNKSYNF